MHIKESFYRKSADRCQEISGAEREYRNGNDGLSASD